MEFTINLGKVDYNENGRRDNAVEIDVELRHWTRPQRTIDLERIAEYTELAICAAIWNHIHTDIYQGGQCLDTVLEFFPDDPLAQEIVEIWERWHLNSMNSGTRAQRNVILCYEDENPDWRYDYGEACDILDAAGLLEDRGYKYGSAWLVEELPQDVIDTVLSWQGG